MIRDAKKKPPAKPRKSKIVVAPCFTREFALLERGIWPVAGCDEAGRGPLAGPVVAAAVVLDPNNIPKGLDDSKKLTESKREALFEEICATSSFAVAYASPARIDRDNILRASLWALARAVASDSATYARLFDEFGLAAEQFVMIGNSLRSDIAPVLELGGWGIHMPYHVTWAHENEAEVAADAPRLRRVDGAAALPEAVRELARAAAT